MAFGGAGQFGRLRGHGGLVRRDSVALELGVGRHHVAQVEPADGVRDRCVLVVVDFGPLLDAPRAQVATPPRLGSDLHHAASPCLAVVWAKNIAGETYEYLQWNSTGGGTQHAHRVE